MENVFVNQRGQIKEGYILKNNNDGTYQAVIEVLNKSYEFKVEPMKDKNVYGESWFKIV